MESHRNGHDSLFLRRDDLDKGEYGLVGLTAASGNPSDDDDVNGTGSPSSKFMESLEVGQEEEEEGEGHDMHLPSPSQLSGWENNPTFFTPLLPDDGLCLGGIQLMDSVEGVRLFKFMAVTWIGLIGMFCLVRWMDFENDTQYTIPGMILHDGQPILMDTMFFFVVARLHRQRGVDHIAWILTAAASGLFTSLETYFPFLQYSVTLYSMHCIWPWTLWIFAVSVVALCAVVVYLHIQTLIQRQQLGMKIFEMSLCVLLFMVPPMTSPYFHFHHWFAGWLVGMHCNLDVWWSRLTLAWCWGAYINGIAVYGRDPLLTCEYAFYLSYNNHCPFLKCYIDAMKNQTQTTYKIMEAQDWRICDAEDYLP